MSDSVNRIARLITEDPDILSERENVFSKYQDKFRDHTVLDAEVFGEIVGILQDVAEMNGLTLDRSRLKVRFNPSGITIKNIILDSPDSVTKRELAHRMADITGDDNIKHTFSKNLKVNLYQAISGEFADRVREELNLEVTHQSRDPGDARDPSKILPMATFTQPAVTAEKPEEEFAEPMGAEPEGGPMPMAPEEELGGLGGGMGGPMGGLPELPSEEGELPEEGAEEEPEVGDFGLEPPAEGEETEGEAEEEEEPAPAVEESIRRIAAMLTEDPDIIEEGRWSKCPKCGNEDAYLSFNNEWECPDRNCELHSQRRSNEINPLGGYDMDMSKELKKFDSVAEAFAACPHDMGYISYDYLCGEPGCNGERSAVGNDWDDAGEYYYRAKVNGQEKRVYPEQLNDNDTW